MSARFESVAWDSAPSCRAEERSLLCWLISDSWEWFGANVGQVCGLVLLQIQFADEHALRIALD